MSPRLPKEVVAAIELAINIAQSRGVRPDMESIASIFSTTYKSVTLIRKRINTISSTGIDPRKKGGPKPLGGADPDEIERCIREVTAKDEETDLNSIGVVVKERFGVELGRSTVSRFINARNIPFKGGRGGPKGKGGSGRGRAGSRRKPASVERQPTGLLPEVTAAEDGTMYTSPYTPSMVAQNDANLASVYGQHAQNGAAHAPYSQGRQ
jgi:hypothetical protein